MVRPRILLKDPTFGSFSNPTKFHATYYLRGLRLENNPYSGCIWTLLGGVEIPNPLVAWLKDMSLEWRTSWDSTGLNSKLGMHASWKPKGNLWCYTSAELLFNPLNST